MCYSSFGDLKDTNGPNLKRVSKAVVTQVGRALSQLGIEHIEAYLPQARGRSERVFHTLGPSAEGVQVGWDRHDRGGQTSGSAMRSNPGAERTDREVAHA
jgi:hypothetical protein